MEVEPGDVAVGVMMALFGLAGLFLAAGSLDDEMYVFGLSLAGFAAAFDFGLVKRHFDRAALAASLQPADAVARPGPVHV